MIRAPCPHARPPTARPCGREQPELFGAAAQHAVERRRLGPPIGGWLPAAAADPGDIKAEGFGAGDATLIAVSIQRFSPEFGTSASSILGLPFDRIASPCPARKCRKR